MSHTNDNDFSRLRSDLADVNSLSAWKPNSIMLSTFIPVNSIEQFVPVFASYFVENQTKTRDFLLFDTEEARNKAMKALSKIPTFYTVPIPEQILKKNTPKTPGSNRLRNASVAMAAGSGMVVSNSFSQQDQPYFTLPGFLGKVNKHLLHVDTFALTPEYRLSGLMTGRPTSPFTLSSLMLLVTKAKYIPQLKTALLLETEVELPYGSMKLLRNKSATDYEQKLIRSLIHDLGFEGALDRQEMKLEHASDEEMSTYVWNSQYFRRRSFKEQVASLAALRGSSVQIPMRGENILGFNDL